MVGIYINTNKNVDITPWLTIYTYFYFVLLFVHLLCAAFTLSLLRYPLALDAILYLLPSLLPCYSGASNITTFHSTPCILCSVGQFILCHSKLFQALVFSGFLCSLTNFDFSLVFYLSFYIFFINFKFYQFQLLLKTSFCTFVTGVTCFCLFLLAFYSNLLYSNKYVQYENFILSLD